MSASAAIADPKRAFSDPCGPSKSSCWSKILFKKLKNKKKQKQSYHCTKLDIGAVIYVHCFLFLFSSTFPSDSSTLNSFPIVFPIQFALCLKVLARITQQNQRMLCKVLTANTTICMKLKCPLCPHLTVLKFHNTLKNTVSSFGLLVFMQREWKLCNWT